MRQKINYVQKIIDRILDFANLKTLPEEEEKRLRVKLEDKISERLGFAILKNLSEEGMKEYEKFVSEGDFKSSKFRDFLKKYLPDYKEKIKKEMDSFITEMILVLAK